MTESEIDHLAEDFRTELSDEEEGLLDIEDNEAATVPPPWPHYHPGAPVPGTLYVSLSTLVMLKR